jgi:hypothetical protein
MPLKSTDIFNVGSTATAVGADPENQARIVAASEAIYYKNASDVSSSSTELAKGSSVTTEETLWIISKGTESKVFVEHLSGPVVQDLSVTDDLKVTDTLTVTGTSTTTGGIVSSGTLPGVYAGNWSPVAATSGTNSTPAEKKLYVTSLFLPANKKIKGIGYLIGETGGTNKVVAGLFNSAGTLLAHSSETTEGATVGTAANVQSLDLTAEYEAVGPKLYYVGITMNGNTARYRSIPANTAGANVWTGEKTLETKNVLATFTEPPTTFTGDKGPIAFVY